MPLNREGTGLSVSRDGGKVSNEQPEFFNFSLPFLFLDSAFSFGFIFLFNSFASFFDSPLVIFLIGFILGIAILPKLLLLSDDTLKELILALVALLILLTLLCFPVVYFLFCLIRKLPIEILVGMAGLSLGIGLFAVIWKHYFPFNWYIWRLRSQNGKVRANTVRALGELGDKSAVKPLINALSDSDSSVRSVATRALGELGDKSAVKPLINALSDSDSSVRSVATRALGELGDKSAVEPLIDALADSEVHVRGNAARALEKLGATKEQLLEGYLKALSNSDVKVRGNAARTLGELGDRKAVEPLIDALVDSSSEVRKNAARALGELGDKRAVEPLIDALADSSSEVRKNAARALGELGDKRAVEPLIDALANLDSVSGDCIGVNANVNVCVAAASALGELGDRRAVEPLINALAESSSDVRKSAARALEKLGATKEQLFEGYLKALSSSNSDVREDAAEALGELGDKRAIKPLEKILQEEPPTVEEHLYDSYGYEWETFIKPNSVCEAVKRALIKINWKRTERVTEEAFTPPKGLNTSLINKALKGKRIGLKEDIAFLKFLKIDLKDIKDKNLKAFLKFLKRKHLEDIVVMGGAVRDIFFDKAINDIDVTVKLALTDKEREDFIPTTSQATRRVYDYAMQQLEKLANALGVKREDLQRPPLDPAAPRFKGLNIQYLGPIQSTTSEGVPVFNKRFIIDSQTRQGFSSNTRANLLQMAIDCYGNLYGYTESLQDLLKGRVRVVGDGNNFAIGDILRLLRLKHQFGLEIYSQDYELVTKVLNQYARGELSISEAILPMIKEQMKKVLDDAVDRKAAEEELEKLGISALIKKK